MYFGAIRKFFSDDGSNTCGTLVTIELLPEIKARFYNNEILINFHCEKRKGVLERILSELEKLKLSVVNSSVITFGVSALNIIVVAEVFTAPSRLSFKFIISSQIHFN